MCETKPLLLVVLLVLLVLAVPAEAGVASMLAGSSLAQAGFWSQFGMVFKMVLQSMPTDRCKMELGRFQRYVDSGEIRQVLSEAPRAQRAMCKAMSKPCVQELGTVMAGLAGRETMKKQLQDHFGAEADDETDPRYQLDNMLDKYYDKVCAAAKQREQEDLAGRVKKVEL